MPRPLPRFTERLIPPDPIELAIAQLEAREQAAREAVAAGSTPMAAAQDLRGIPAIGRGSGGRIAGTDPLAALLAKERRAGR